MALKCGIVGLPNVGKSTLFNCLSKTKAQSANYPFCTIDPNVGLITVPDSRLDVLAELVDPDKIHPSTVEIVDIAGLVKGASKGEGLGNKFLSNIRETDAIIHVLRCFEDENITHVDGLVNPIRDAETIQTELLLADIEILERRRQKIEKLEKSGDKEAKTLLILIEKLIEHCSSGNASRTFKCDNEDINLKHALQLLTDKSVLYIANVDDRQILKKEYSKHVKDLISFASSEGNRALCLCASLEQEIAQLHKDEKLLFLNEYNLKEPGLNTIIHSSYELLGLQTFFTCGENEVRAWTISNNTSAPNAAGKIHTDFQRGFIKADVFHYNDIMAHGSEKSLRELGLIRQEGKNYIVKDGDCIFFKFNV